MSDLDDIIDRFRQASNENEPSDQADTVGVGFFGTIEVDSSKREECEQDVKRAIAEITKKHGGKAIEPIIRPLPTQQPTYHGS